MGQVVAGVALAAVSVASSIGRAKAEKEAADANISAINQQSQLLTLSYQEKNIQNLEMTEKILQRQAVQLSTRGVSFASPSFNAIQRETIHLAGRKESNLKVEEDLAKAGLQTEKANVKNTLHAQLFGEATNLAFNAYNVYDRIPKSLPQVEDI
jgi:hypothetical protein